MNCIILIVSIILYQTPFKIGYRAL